MSKGYHISVTGGITIIQLNHNPSYDLVKSIIDELSEKELYLLRLWDLRGTNFDWSTDMLTAIAAYGKRKFIKPNKAAFLVDMDLAFGEIRVFMAHREEEGKSYPSVFRDYEKAMEFLNT